MHKKEKGRYRVLARYKKHTIRYGETLQSIASLELGDVNQWPSLVRYNNLVYPYIVDSDGDKVNNVEHLVSLGDSIIIPVPDDLNDTSMDNLSSQDKQEVSKLALGEDLSMIDFPDYYQDRGTQDEIFQLNSNGQGDLATVYGVNNVKQVLMARLLTPRGSLILHPTYGSDLHKLFLQGTPATVEMINNAISQSLQDDTRVSGVSLESSLLDRGKYTSSWKVSLISIETQFELLVKRDASGNFTLE